MQSTNLNNSNGEEAASVPQQPSINQDQAMASPTMSPVVSQPPPASGLVGQDDMMQGDREGGKTGDVEKTSRVNEEGSGSESGKATKSAKVGNAFIPQSTIDKINRVKIPNLKDSEEVKPETVQSLRKIKVDKALRQYKGFKAIHESAIKSFTDFQKELEAESNDDVDVDGELEHMLYSLSLSEASLRRKEERVNSLVMEGNDEVEIIPFKPPSIRVVRPVATRKKTAAPMIKSRGDRKRRSSYIDDEAVEANGNKEEGSNGEKRRKKEMQAKSDEYYFDDGEFDEDDGNETTDVEGGSGEGSSSEDGGSIKGPSQAKKEEVVVAQGVKQKKKKVAVNGPEAVASPYNIDSNSMYHDTDGILDLTLILNNTTPAEANYLERHAKLLTSNQFDWGSALKESVIGTISGWDYHEGSQLGQPTGEALQPVIVLLKRMSEEKDTLKYLHACPRLLQIAATDPYITPDSIQWSVLQDSTRYPWAKRDRVFRAFHSMACRTGNHITWTAEPEIQNKLNNAYRTLHKILKDSVDLISYDSKHDQIKIKTTGENAILDDMIPLSQSIAWVVQQVMMQGLNESDFKIKRTHHQGIDWFQKRCLLILTGVMLVYERDVYNRQLEKFMLVKRTREEINIRRRQLKGSVINQLTEDYVRKNPQRAIKGVKRGGSVSDELLASVSEGDIIKKANDDAHELRRQAIQALGCFLMFGTSGLFHVWANTKEQKMTDAALLIHLSSVLAQRRKNQSTSHPHVFYQRAWSRLDNHIYSILRLFLSNKDPGSFKKKINWPEMTELFHSKFSPTTIAYLYSLDLCLEMHAPLASRTPDGSIAEDFEMNLKKSKKSTIPITEPFKSVWPDTNAQPDDVFT